jgi:ATP-dependent 26S proteasome regulatory subunit
MENLNSILVIEDAEKILTSREDEKNSAVTTLLNLTDGLLSDCLNIQIICSFNTDISRIDSALLRKGRLIAKYNFKPLAVKKANALARSLGLNSHFSEPTKLTDIYNDADIGFEAQETKMAIGF